MTILPVSKKLMNEIIEKKTPLGKFYSGINDGRIRPGCFGCCLCLVSGSGFSA